jgi:hypothetical protein
MVFGRGGGSRFQGAIEVGGSQCYTAFGFRQPVSLAAIGRQRAKIDLAAGVAKRVGQLLRQDRRKIAVIGRHQPRHLDAGRLAERAGSRDQSVRRADLIGKIIGKAAAAGREGDDGSDLPGVFAGQRQRPPGAGRMPDHDHAVRPDEGLLAHKARGRRDLVGGGAAGSGIVGVVAATLVLEVFPARRTMARTFRHQHGKAAADQPRRQRAVFRLRHLRASQHVLGGGVRDHGQRKRAVAGRAKQDRMRRRTRVRRRHQPWLQAIWPRFGALRAESRLRRSGRDTECDDDQASEKHSHQMHERA